MIIITWSYNGHINIIITTIITKNSRSSLNRGYGEVNGALHHLVKNFIIITNNTITIIIIIINIIIINNTITIIPINPKQSLIIIKPVSMCKLVLWECFMSSLFFFLKINGITIKQSSIMIILMVHHHLHHGWPEAWERHDDAKRFDLLRRSQGYYRTAFPCLHLKFYFNWFYT